MSEYYPEEPNYLDRQSLYRFEADLEHAASFYDLQNAFITYLIGQFLVSEDSAKQLYTEVSKQLPSAELFYDDIDIAHEQMRLGLIRVVLPIAEEMIASKTVFVDWLSDASRAAMNLNQGIHQVESCVKAPRGVTQLNCMIGPNCPVKVVKYHLIADSMKPDFTSLDYTEPWAASKKIEKTLAKLTVAETLGLTVDLEYTAHRVTYLERCAANGAYIPENGEI
jgi:hypothetical protein